LLVGYDLTQKGRSVLEAGPIFLPIPAFIRDISMKTIAKNHPRITFLENAGVNNLEIPLYELEVDDGEIMRSLETWCRYRENLMIYGKKDLLISLDDLQMRIESWRSDMALQIHIAPSIIMAKHLLFSVAYMTAALPMNVHIDHDALVTAGLRMGNMESLIENLNQWLAETYTLRQDAKGNSDRSIPVPDEPLQPSKPWKRQANKKWKKSYDRFIAGEDPRTIAITQSDGKPIQAATVVSHLLTALTNGHPLALKRVTEVSPLPTVAEWNLLALCESRTKIDVCRNVNDSHFPMTEFLVPILGNAFALKKISERTQDEKEKLSKYIKLVTWYIALRRIGYKVDNE
jgi:hypothetical protein